jgi:hypothetical protein
MNWRLGIMFAVALVVIILIVRGVSNRTPK